MRSVKNLKQVLDLDKKFGIIMLMQMQMLMFTLEAAMRVETCESIHLVKPKNRVWVQ